MPLAPPRFRPSPLAAVEPRGWLARQLRIQASGLSGHLDQFWPDIRDSAWIGGKAEGWERMPYWLDGAIPLAWLTGDAALQARIAGYLDTILARQGADGWLGPRPEETHAAADLWSQALALKMLTVYHDATGDARIPDAVARALRKLDRVIDRNPLSKWGQFRWFEFLIALWWLYDREADPAWLDLAIKLQAQGFHWRDFFAHWPLTAATEKGRWNYAGHVVNNAMAIKEGGLWWRLSRREADRQAPGRMIAALDRHHGMPTGLFTGDECLAGLDAAQGTELCAVVEFLFSLECLASLLGDAAFADRMEQIAFNALPATFSPDMWAHQYDQQLNQIACSIRPDRNWTTNGPESNLFGLEPNYGCCTANLSQGWPKFAASLWMRAADGAPVAMAYAPSHLKADIGGVPVEIELETDYPFRADLQFTIRPAQPVRFPLLLRIPAWCQAPAVTVAGHAHPASPSQGFLRIERLWEGRQTVRLSLPMETRLIPRPRGALSVSRGPLLFALPLTETWTPIHRDKPGREPPHGDWDVQSPSAWNYALALPESHPESAFSFAESPIPESVFTADAPPVTGTVLGRRVPEWHAAQGSAAPPPDSPVAVATPAEALTLVPYGCARLRIAEFPVARTP